MKAGQKVGPFVIEKPIGSGAMGSVYQARYVKTGKPVAIKFMAPGLGTNDMGEARFEREAEMLKQLDHPNIVRFYAASRFEGTPYYAMEYIEGEPLDQILKRRGRLMWDEVVELGKQVCAALQHAHDQGIVHRDLKPPNLMVTADGTLKLTDFGIAKDLDVSQLTATNHTVGTAAYMSPEQVKGERNLSHKSDLYSLGVVLYELLTGQKPFQAETTMDMFLAHVQGTFERPARLVLDIPVWLDNLVCQMLEKKPEHRPFDASVISLALNQVAEKMLAQQSAGVDAASKRILDRKPGNPVKADASDKKAARSLLTSMGKIRKKKRRKPFYEKAWFQGTGLVILLVAIATVIFVAFRPPSADKLYEQSKRIVAADNMDEMVKARKEGPIEQFLKHYKGKDPRSDEVQQWADEIDVAHRFKTLNNRRGLFAPDNEYEQTARHALQQEENGDLNKASEYWQKLVSAKGQPDPDDRVWGLLAEASLLNIQKAHEIETRLRSEMAQAPRSGKSFQPPDELENRAAVAIRYEDLGDIEFARARWLDLRQLVQADAKKRAWRLLADSKLNELKPKLPAPGEEKKARLAGIEQRNLQLAQTVVVDPIAAKVLCEELLALYETEMDADVRAALMKTIEQLRKVSQ